jgi:hypothetical protein
MGAGQLPVLGEEGTEHAEVSLMDSGHDGHSDRIVVTKLHNASLPTALVFADY